MRMMGLVFVATPIFLVVCLELCCISNQQLALFQTMKEKALEDNYPAPLDHYQFGTIGFQKFHFVSG